MRHDAELHQAILDEGDDAAAERIGRDVAHQLGLEPGQIETLMRKD